MDAFIGTILPWPVPFAPYGWALCQGQTLSIAQNSALFALIGTTYGGDGRSTFCLPNLCGRFPIGVGRNPDSGSQFTLGQTNKNETVTLQASNLPAHNHQITNTVTVNSGGGTFPVNLDIGIPVNTDPYQTTYINSPTGNNCTLATGKTSTSLPTNIYTTNAPTSGATLKPFSVQSSITVNPPTVNVNSACGITGSSNPFNIIPSFLGINYIIALTGIFPSRE
jgi:Microcystin-dependent protein